MSVWLLSVVVSVIVLAVLAMATLVVVLVRRTDTRAPSVAAPGEHDHRVEAARLVADLDARVTGARTALDFARLQLSSAAPDELAGAITEARASVSELSTALAETGGAPPHGPAGTEAAGRLSSALQRAEAAGRRLGGAEAQVQRETREIGPPA